MTSRPHDLNGEEPGHNDHRGGRAERHPTVRGCAARGGFGASSIRQPRDALNSMICAPPRLKSAQALSAPIRPARYYLLVGMPPGNSGLSESDHHHPEEGVPDRTCRLPGKSRVSCEPHRNPTSRRHGGRWPPCSCGPGGYCRTGHVESLTFGPFRPLPTGPRATVRRG